MDGSIEVSFDWKDPSGKVVLMEIRRMTFYAEPVYRIVDFDFELIAVTGVTFGRCRRHHARRLLPH